MDRGRRSEAGISPRWLSRGLSDGRKACWFPFHHSSGQLSDHVLRVSTRQQKPREGHAAACCHKPQRSAPGEAAGGKARWKSLGRCYIAMRSCDSVLKPTSGYVSFPERWQAGWEKEVGGV